MQPIEKIQRKATRLWHYTKCGITYKERLKAIGLQQLYMQQIWFNCCLAYKLQNSLLPNITKQQLGITNVWSKHNTSYFVEKITRNQTIGNHYAWRITGLWNSIPNKIKATDSYSQFKRELRVYLDTNNESMIP